MTRIGLLTLVALSLIVGCKTWPAENEAENAAVGAMPDGPSLQVSPFLMFQKGDAKQAMDFYISLFPNATIEELDLYGPEEGAPQGSVQLGRIVIANQRVLFTDSPIKHAFDFTPANSLFVECTNTDEIDALFAKLSEGGSIMMPLGNYGFSERFGFCTDQFGVSWQLNLAAPKGDRAN